MEVMTLKSVDLPAPLGPIRPTISSRARSRSTSVRTLNPPKLLQILSKRRTWLSFVPFIRVTIRLELSHPDAVSSSCDGREKRNFVSILQFAGEAVSQIQVGLAVQHYQIRSFFFFGPWIKYQIIESFSVSTGQHFQRIPQGPLFHLQPQRNLVIHHCFEFGIPDHCYFHRGVLSFCHPLPRAFNTTAGVMGKSSIRTPIALYTAGPGNAGMTVATSSP